jgi:hypothetical protein
VLLAFTLVAPARAGPAAADSVRPTCPAARAGLPSLPVAAARVGLGLAVTQRAPLRPAPLADPLSPHVVTACAGTGAAAIFRPAAGSPADEHCKMKRGE